MAAAITVNRGMQLKNVIMRTKTTLGCPPKLKKTSHFSRNQVILQEMEPTLDKNKTKAWPRPRL